MRSRAMLRGLAVMFSALAGVSSTTEMVTPSDAGALPTPRVTRDPNAEIVLDNRDCFTDVYGRIDCRANDQRGVCCLTYSPQGAAMLSCTLQALCVDGDFVPVGETTPDPTTTESTTTTMMVPVLLDNTACDTSQSTSASGGPADGEDPVQNCRLGQPKKVCCAATAGAFVTVSCATEITCANQQGDFVPFVDTTTTSTSTTTASRGNMISSTTTTTTTPIVVDNSACVTLSNITVDCTNQEPRRICCGVRQGQVVSRQCLLEEQCDQQNGVYTTLPVLSTTGPTTAPLDTSSITSASTLATTLATTLPSVNNVACAVTRQSVQSCMNREPAAVCCAVFTYPEWVTTCMSAELCELQDGLYDNATTNTTTLAAAAPTTNGDTSPTAVTTTNTTTGTTTTLVANTEDTPPTLETLPTAPPTPPPPTTPPTQSTKTSTTTTSTTTTTTVPPTASLSSRGPPTTTKLSTTAAALSTTPSTAGGSTSTRSTTAPQDISTVATTTSVATPTTTAATSPITTSSTVATPSVSTEAPTNPTVTDAPTTTNATLGELDQLGITGVLDRKSEYAILGAILAVVLVIVIIAIVCCCKAQQRKKYAAQNKANIRTMLRSSTPHQQVHNSHK
jgi:hypothetical protein